MACEIVGENLVAERGAFTFLWESGGEEIRDVSFVYCPNLIAKVADIIQQHKRQVSGTTQILINSLHTPRSSAGLPYHGGAIPEDELWIILGGDEEHGGFKFHL